MQSGAVAVADVNKGARPLLQHESEILRAHHRRKVAIDLIWPCDLARNIGNERGTVRIVHQHGILPRPTGEGETIFSCAGSPPRNIIIAVGKERPNPRN
jgi:hypothetical protein